MKKFSDTWYSKDSPLLFRLLLRPLSFLFRIISGFRRWLYRSGRKHVYRASRPVIVVGNISVGGTGKTPLIVYLAQQLMAAGYHPGIVSRGYGSKAPSYPFAVTAASSVREAGDEALLIAMNTGCPVVIDAQRGRALSWLEQHHDCDVILSDDGMQHYAMARDIEIAVVDGKRGFGNGRLLPEGPLRELPERLQEVDFLVINGTPRHEFPEPYHVMSLKPQHLCHIRSGRQLPLEYVHETQQDRAAQANKNKVHAVAGIGNPERFFSSLCDCGFDIITHIYRDHHAFSEKDISFGDELDVVMTEKDAVKCKPFARDRDWYLKVAAVMDEDFMTALLERIRSLYK